MTILVVGQSGQVARALAERAGEDVHLIACGRPQLDIRDAASINAAFAQIRPDLVINASAYTAVDKAETEIAEAMAINSDGPALLAEACNKAGIPLIHYSTDYVFDGSKTSAYAEADPTSPPGVYGRTKLAGERAIAAATGDYIILRTAWVYSPFGGNFVKTMLRLAGERDELTIVADQIGCPTSALDIADATLTIADTVQKTAARPGIFHLCGAGETSWAGLAEEIFKVSKAAGGPSARVKPIPTEAYPTPAKRPANSRMDCTKIASEYDIQMPHWRDSVRACVERLIEQED